MLYLRGAVKEMDKKEKNTEQKKEESKEIKTKQEVKKQQYSVEEFAQNAESLFCTKPECVLAAFQIANIKTATEEQAKKIVKSFLEMEV